MDALALLCNLHADGPATLRLLRRTGLRTLADIEARAPESLAEVLGVSPNYARRFAREARLLGERMGVSCGDAEESGMSEISALAESAREPDGAPSLPFPATTARDTWLSSRWAARPAHATPSLHADASPYASVARDEHAGADVAGAEVRGAPTADDARRADRARADRAHVVDAAQPVDARESAVTDWQPRERSSASVTPATIVREHGTPLRPGAIEGLDATWCDRLIAQGVRSLEALAESAGLKLAKRIELPYPRLLEFQCLARRAVQSREPSARPEHGPEHDPALEVAARAALDRDAAGRGDSATDDGSFRESTRDPRAFSPFAVGAPAASPTPVSPLTPWPRAQAPSARSLETSEPIYLMRPARRPEAPASLDARPATLSAAERARASAPARDANARDGRGAYAPDREFGPRITDAEVAGPFA